MRPGSPEERTHDSSRNGTAFLFAALDAPIAEVIGTCFRKQRAVC